MTSPLDDALHRTLSAVDRYGVDQDMIGRAATSLQRMPAERRQEVEVTALVDAVVHMAVVHGGPHGGCSTCLAVANAVAVAMGVVRAETDLRLQEMLEE
jgi:hypothetical protein